MYSITGKYLKNYHKDIGYMLNYFLNRSGVAGADLQTVL